MRPWIEGARKPVPTRLYRLTFALALKVAERSHVTRSASVDTWIGRTVGSWKVGSGLSAEKSFWSVV